MTYDSRCVDAVQMVKALGKVGIKIRALTEAAELYAGNPIPETVALPTFEDSRARMTAVIGDPKRLAAVVADVAFRRSTAAADARELAATTRDIRVLALFADAAADMDSSLVRALKPARVEVEAAESALARLGMPRPRIMQYSRDGDVTRAVPNVAKGQLREQAVARRDEGEALAAVHRWEDAMTTYATLHGIVGRLVRLRALPAEPGCIELTRPIAAPPELSELKRRADVAARRPAQSAPRREEAFSTLPDEARVVWTGSTEPEEIPA